MKAHLRAGASCRCDIFAKAFVALGPQINAARKNRFFAQENDPGKPAGLVPKLRLGETYAPAGSYSNLQKLLPVVGEIGYARH
jgi:hypothetical protein